MTLLTIYYDVTYYLLWRHLLFTMTSLTITMTSLTIYYDVTNYMTSLTIYFDVTNYDVTNYLLWRH